MQYTHPPARRRSPLAPVVLAGVLFFLALFASRLEAANFTVSPVIGDIPPETRIAVFEVTNNATAPLSFQVQAYAWTQQDGEDVREPAENLLIVPPVATVEAGKSQLVRVALRESDRAREHAYRLVIRELPKQSAETQGFALQTLLAFDVPLFFAPENPTRELTWRAERAADGLIVHVDSTGSRYTRFDRIAVLDGKGRELAALKGPLYVLAGARQSWTAEASSAPAPSRGTPVRLVYSIFGQEHSVPLKIE